MAYALLQEGRLVDAEQLMVRELQTTEQRYGRGSPEWASAQCDLGNLLLSSDQADRAVDCFRSACSGPVPGSPEARKDTLTYRLNLGAVLTMVGRLDEAEAELRRNLEERLAFYGRQHPGYAFGLEPLADVLLERGNIREAREAIEETIGNFWRNGHERVATALALRAEIVTSEGGNEPLFPGLEQLPDPIVEQMAVTVINRTGSHPARDRAVLTDLIPALEARLGPDHQATLNALSHLANTSHDHGDEAGRVEAIQKVLASYERQGRAEQALMAALGLAMAQSDAHDMDGALRTYTRARTLAEGTGRPELSSQVLRNWGLALSEAGRPVEAEPRLREAVAAADLGNDHEMLGRARIALGLFLQHQERLAEAQHVVETGLTNLDVAHPDAIVGRSHLSAIAAGRSCGCGDIHGAIAESFREFVVGRLPQDLLARLDVTIENQNFKLDVELRREPTEDEIAHMNRVIEGATTEFRRRLASVE
ncbi:MAG: tetratricopeptide repeat protein [Actinomadura sp.]